MTDLNVTNLSRNIDNWNERVDLAAAFRCTADLNMHEGVANHFSFAINPNGTKFLMNPDQMHFSRIKASDLLVVDALDPNTMNQPNAPDATAWGLHGAIHRHCPHARCALHVHSKFATVLATLEDASLPPIDQNCATFYNRYVIDNNYGGLAFEAEGERCATLLTNPQKKVLIMGNHGIMVIGETVADTFNRLYYFERACETYIRALQTGRKLRFISSEIAEKTAVALENFSDAGDRHLEELKYILDEQGSNYAS
jgi:ribulose-5-phosphate 4-epimerase/fuculose-1-phosphate aldolase|tara:strand:- start:1368 stop:2132 length:765 start_codon:yes stop_codon:yes gene_type:complete